MSRQRGNDVMVAMEINTSGDTVDVTARFHNDTDCFYRQVSSKATTYKYVTLVERK